MSELVGWALLHSKLPSQALKPLSESVYGVSGLTDVNEGFLIQRLFASKLPWQWRLVEQSYLGFEDRVSGGGKNYRVYLASAHGILEIEGREFHGAGAHDNRKLDAAYKGAATVSFKNACKLAGLTIELFKDGRAMDFLYESPEKNAPTREGNDHNGSGATPAEPPLTIQAPPPAPAPSRTPTQIAEDARKHVKPAGAGYDDTTAVCPDCGRAEYLSRDGSFCAKAKGGCGWPKARGEKGTAISWAEFKRRQ